MEYRRDDAGRLIEVPLAVLDCGHPNGPRRVIVGFEWHQPSGRRVRCYTCRQCGKTSYTP